jgi:hypothetical protein
VFGTGGTALPFRKRSNQPRASIAKCSTSAAGFAAGAWPKSPKYRRFGPFNSLYPAIA